jgi:hypothetical protein
MNTESKLYVCLVCHTEPDVWNGGFRSIDTILPRFVKMLDTVSDSAGSTPRVAWCITSQVAQQRAQPFRELDKLGHEIGVHSHFPAASGKLEHQRELNRDNLDDFQSWFPKLCSQIVEAGFPSPRTHTTWMFAYRDSMTQVLRQAGIAAECSVCYGGTHSLPDGFLLADSRKRTTGKPYRLSVDDHCVAGNSPVIEMPVSGGLGCYWEPDGKGGFDFFYPIASDAQASHQLQLLHERVGGLSLGEIDIFQIHFHLYEFLPRDGSGKERLRRAQWLLSSIGQLQGVRFATPSQAVEAWMQTERKA